MFRTAIKFISSFAIVGLFLAACDPATVNSSSLNVKTSASKSANGGFPTVFRIYALGSDHLFYGYDFYSLTLEPKDVLGITLRAELDEVEIAPGTSMVFGPYTLPSNTRNIGVIGTFQSGERAKWRDTVPVDSTSIGQHQVLVVIDKQQISVTTPAAYNAAVRKSQQTAAEREAAKAEAQKQAQIRASNASQIKAKRTELANAKTETRSKRAEAVKAANTANKAFRAADSASGDRKNELVGIARQWKSEADRLTREAESARKRVLRLQQELDRLEGRG